jgi:hypothetical protein
MSIVLGESQRDVRTRPYFRGRAVCSHADIEIGSVLALRIRAPSRAGGAAGHALRARPGQWPGRSSATVQPSAIPAVSALEVTDPAFGASAPLDEPAEPPRMFGVPAGGRDLGLAQDGDRADPSAVQVPVCGGLAVTSMAVTERGTRPACRRICLIAGDSGWRHGFACDNGS